MFLFPAASVFIAVRLWQSQRWKWEDSKDRVEFISDEVYEQMIEDDRRAEAKRKKRKKKRDEAG